MSFGPSWRAASPAVRAVVVGALLLFPACGGSDTPTSPTPPPPAPPGALAITCPATVTVQANSTAPIPVTIPPATTTGGTAPVTVSCPAPPGGVFPIGTTRLTCTATDARQQTASCSFDVIVQPPPPRLSKTDYLAFGDSLTAGEVTVPAAGTARDADGFPAFALVVVPSASYPTQLQSLLRLRYTIDAGRIAVNNLGRPGETAEEGARRFPDAYRATRPQVVLLLEGANDLAQLGARGINTAAAAIESMAGHARLSGSDVFIASLPPGRPNGRNTLPESLLRPYNDRLRTVAAGQAATFVDLYTPLGADVNTYIGVDGLHPTEAGYRRMAEVFFEALRARYETR
jgi:lysophospholipase L1-like esterase